MVECEELSNALREILVPAPRGAKSHQYQSPAPHSSALTTANATQSSPAPAQGVNAGAKSITTPKVDAGRISEMEAHFGGHGEQESAAVEQGRNEPASKAAASVSRETACDMDIPEKLRRDHDTNHAPFMQASS